MVDKNSVARLKTLIKADERLSGTPYEQLVSDKDLRNLQLGRRCVKWIVTPDGRVECIEWADVD